MGSFNLDVRTSVEPDPAQAHYLPLISPDWVKKSTVWKLFQNYMHAFGRDFRRLTTEARDIDLITGPLVEAGWGGRFD